MSYFVRFELDGVYDFFFTECKWLIVVHVSGRYQDCNQPIMFYRKHTGRKSIKLKSLVITPDYI